MLAMSDLIQPPPLARASTRRSRRVSTIWIVPLVAIAIGVWLAWDTLSKEGPTITISFDSGEGLQAGQSQLKFKDIVFGTVKSLTLTPNHARVLVRVATTRQAEPLLTDKTIFWVVRPRISLGSVSGLSTLLSGSYIGMLPQTGGTRQNHFVGNEEPPVLQANVPGRIFLLKADRLGSISQGSPIYYRDLVAGEVLGWDFADMAESVSIRAFVRAPFDGYVHDETRFWNASGLSVKLAGAGVQVQLESLQALLLGGIAFDTPTTDSHAPPTPANHVFPLFADRDAAANADYSRRIPVVSYFPGSVRGLGPGSEVTMHGLKVGQVTDVRLMYDRAKDAIVAPVHYLIEPERILGIGVKDVFKTPAEAADVMVKRGLRATLQSASLITGQQEVGLVFDPKAPPATVTMEGPNFVLPSVGGGGFASLEASATDLLNQLNTIPFTQMGQQLTSILGGLNDATTSPEMRQSLKDLAAMIANTNDMVRSLNKDLAPATQQLPALTAGLQRTLTNTNKLLMSLDNAYGDNTSFNRELERLLRQTNEAMSSLSALADLLTRHPEALIKGRPGGGME
jgi:paraquat-inducible protein B